MYVKRLFSILFALLMMVSTAMADGKVSFAKTAHDFGTIKESDGDVTYEFQFSNTGNLPILILRATASCGCTSPEFPKQPIRPGEKGVISVTYHAKGRPGPFEKSIHVYDNNNKRTLLTITGNVLSSRSAEDDYSIQLGAGLRLKTKSLNFFDVYPNRAARTRTLHVYNEGDNALQLTFRNVPKHIGIECEPEIILPKKEAKVLVTYYTSKVKDWGMRRDYFELYVQGRESQMQNNRIAVMADIWEDFSGLTRGERDRAAQIEVEGQNLDFGIGDVERNMVVTILNTGQDKLTIRKIQNDMPDVFDCKLEANVIKPGQSTTMTVTFRPSQLKQSSITHHVTIISNDPSNSRVIVNMTGDK